MVRAAESQPVVPVDGTTPDFLQKACIYICKPTLKLSNGELVRVPINNNYYEQPIAFFVILQAETPLLWCNSL